MTVAHVVGTAGHVDHGKSALVRALTGIDPDRLAEERRRGMTIELGFAAWTLPDGARVGIVDVPGHHRLVRTMIAGAQGVDLVLLVVAADEGVMPQTREHLDICELLDIRSAVVALSKADLVDAETLALAREDIDDTLASTPFAGAPVVPVSAVDGRGLQELAEVVGAALASASPAPDRGRPRLFVDRAFALPGFGPIVTGTLEGGSLHAGDEVVVLPEGRRARVRGLQRHGEDLAGAAPGGRTAVNLAGVDLRDLRRGQAVVRPGGVPAVRRLDVRLRSLPGAPPGLRHGAAVGVHLGTTEVAARLWLLDQDRLERGSQGWAQLRLATPVPAVPGDRLVIRSPGRSATLGGGLVVATDARTHRRRDPVVAAAMERRATLLADALVQEELRASRLGMDVAGLSRATGCSAAEVEAALGQLGSKVVRAGRRHLAREAWDGLAARSTALLEGFHAAEPLRRGMPPQEWRSRLRLPAELSADVLHRLAAGGVVRVEDGAVRLPGHASRGDAAAAGRALELLRAAGLDPPGPARLAAEGLTPPLLRHLVESGAVIRLSADVLLAAEVFEGARQVVVDLLAERGAATVAEIRDTLGATRRVVVPLLEVLDARRVTRRDGDLRRLR